MPSPGPVFLHPDHPTSPHPQQTLVQSPSWCISLLSSICIQLLRKSWQVQLLASGQASLLRAVLPGAHVAWGRGRLRSLLGNSRKVLRSQRLGVN